MGENEAIQNSEHPQTVDTLAEALHNLGVKPGMVLLVHSSLSKLGWVCGGAVAVVQALMKALTPEGTLVMPTHSGDLTDPSRWQHPPVPESWWQTIREQTPAFDPQFTPTRGMGRIPEVFRDMPGVLRSNHPTVSFAAFGRQAEFITSRHSLALSLGEGSPLARVYDLHGSILLLGVGFGNHTSFHLSEARAKGSKIYREGSPIIEAGKRTWKVYDEIDWDDEPFENIGRDFMATGEVTSGRVGAAAALLFDQRRSVDFGVSWLEKHRAMRENKTS